MNENMISLSNIAEGRKAKVKNIDSSGSIRRRLQDIGLIEGTEVECLQKSPAGDPIAYLIRGAVIALRCEDSRHIMVELS